MPEESVIEKTVLYLCIENDLFREYLEESFKENNYNFSIVTVEKLYKIAPLLLNGVLILQSEKNDVEIISVSKN